MALRITCTCDNCDNTIPEGNGRLTLTDSPASMWVGQGTTVRHFCNTNCLRVFINNHYTQAAPHQPSEHGTLIIKHH